MPDPSDSSVRAALRDLFARYEDIELAVLIGSRATATAHEHSDWDFAVQWRRGIAYYDTLGKTEELRAALAGRLNVTANNIDIVDMPTGRLAIRAVIANQGVLLKGDDQLPWSRFLLRTWRDLEDFVWEREHAA